MGIALVLALAAAGAGLALAACARGGGAQAASTARTVGSVPTTSGARTVLTAPQAPGVSKALRSRSWVFRGLGDHGRVVLVRYAEGDCWGGGRAHVTQTEASVTIELLQSYSGGAGVACPLFILLRNLRVQLRAPLGQRHLLHAPVAGRG